ncbi:hypothetical protein AK830_g11043 [Neonectria ditissima]|uniref:CST complex subunit STN1 n=1 Tax=Neonectria ditissima TaxID=78410 RepID=A0A0P7AE59_9HYPO|nr:hypothetical protein AK830_g11043 [Neonectria ditissima]
MHALTDRKEARDEDAMADPSKPPIYPRYCFHLAPTVNTWCLLHAALVHDLEQHAGFEGENFYFYKNLPIKWVRIVGVVVAIDEYAGRRIYTVDDSSGACIECTIGAPAPVREDAAKKDEKKPAKKVADIDPPATSTPYEDIRVGSVVDVKGGVSIFRDEKQINIEKMAALRSTAQEVALWEKRTKLRAEVLDKPWVLRRRDIRRCGQEAEQSEEKAERKRKRLKVMIEGRADAEQSVKRPHKQTKASSDKQPSSKTSLELRQILQHGGAGKYDALGL